MLRPQPPTAGAAKATEQAKFEANKVLWVNKLNSEVSQLSSEIERAKAGGLQAPELDELVNRVEVVQAQLAAKKAELEAVQAEKFEAAAEAAPSVRYCPNRGAAVQPRAKLLPLLRAEAWLALATLMRTPGCDRVPVQRAI